MIPFLLALVTTSVIPRPMSIEMQSGFLDATPGFNIRAPGECRGVSSVLATFRGGSVPLTVALDAPTMGEEGYTLEVTNKDVLIRAAKPAGAFFAAQSLKQLLLESRTLHAQVIVDKPRFAWRGMHLDCSRHFFSKSEIKAYLDYLSTYKFNTFHWHLVDDGGWRMESKHYPLLTSQGAWRKEIPGVVWDYSRMVFPLPTDPNKGKLYGGFYTQKDIREIVKYAGERFVTIVPEIEMPGHCLPAVLAYPELGCSVEKLPGDPYKTTSYCPGKEQSFKFAETILEEAMGLFPSKIIHIGGDEVDHSFWNRCPDCLARMKSEGLQDSGQLQSYFLKRIENFLNQNGRSMIGWDEILMGGLAPNAMVMSWRGESGGIAAAKAGHRVVMSPTSHCYFDYGYDGTSTKHVYGYEPVPAELSAEEATNVVGAQGNVWTEWMPNFARVQYMIFPRMLALSEALWTPREQRDFGDFSRRLDLVYPRLIESNVSFFAEPPRATANLIFFANKCKVELRKPSIKGLELRYTLDGRSPTSSSPLYAEPIEVAKPTEVRAANFAGKRMLGEPVVVNACAKKNLEGNGGGPGLQRELFVQSFNAVPDFAKLQADKVDTVTKLDIEGFDKVPAFALRLRGRLRIAKEGLYTFSTGSDDGSMLFLDGKPLVNNDGLHGYAEVEASAFLMAGSYEVEIGYIEHGGARRLTSSIEGPGLRKTELASICTQP